MGAQPPRLDGDMIAAHVANLSRAPFRDLLMRILEAEPDTESIREYSTKHPDKCCQAISMIGKLSGYHERLEVANSHVVALAQLSDAALMARLQDSLEKLGIDPQAFRLAVAQKDGVPKLPESGNGSKM